MKILKTFISSFLLSFFLVVNTYAELQSVPKPEGEMVEFSEVEWLIKKPRPGIIFSIRDYDEEALKWTADRANYYFYLIKKAHPDMPIAVLAHGDEVGSLSIEGATRYKKLHTMIQEWIRNYDITFHVCGSMAHMLGLDANDFPDYIDVVPYGPSQLRDYLDLGYKHIELELTW